ncbi:MAG: putative metal-binding motif-containing protein [Myxococcota bacterium]
MRRITMVFLLSTSNALAADPGPELTCGAAVPYFDDCFDCGGSDEVEDNECSTYVNAASQGCDQPTDNPSPDRILNFTAAQDEWVEFDAGYGVDLHMNLYVSQGTNACTSNFYCLDWAGPQHEYADGWGGEMYSGFVATGGVSYRLAFDLNESTSPDGDRVLEVSRFECCPDLDGDGAFNTNDGTDCPMLLSFAPDLVDCDDNDASNFPTNVEVCDHQDNDCDLGVDEGLVLTNWYLDSDGDGHGVGAPFNDCAPPAANWVTQDGDCDDTGSAVHPGAVEVCNGVDDDCTTLADDGISCPGQTSTTSSTAASSATASSISGGTSSSDVTGSSSGSSSTATSTSSSSGGTSTSSSASSAASVVTSSSSAAASSTSSSSASTAASSSSGVAASSGGSSSSSAAAASSSSASAATSSSGGSSSASVMTSSGQAGAQSSSGVGPQSSGAPDSDDDTTSAGCACNATSGEEWVLSIAFLVVATLRRRARAS